ncbi:MAG: ROK family protein [Anaerolineae bacterium]|nr:ROK family protein [Anaerolineae bacterium]
MRWALGIDIGGTHTKMGLVNEVGEIQAFRRIPTDARGSDPQPYLDYLIAQAQQVAETAPERLIGVGLSTHGHLDEERRGPILCENTPALKGVDMWGLLHTTFDWPVVVNNDLTAHAMAEYFYGSGRGVRRFMVLAIGTGLGVGVIVNGKPLRYIEGTPGDSGRLILDPEGPPDVLGVRGTAEGLCGVRGIEYLAQERYGHAVEAHDVIRGAREGTDPIAQAIMAQVGSYLGYTLALLSPIFLPNKIALTGGTTEAGPVMLDACRERFGALVGGYHQRLAHLAPAYYSDVDIVVGQMRGETGVVGAVAELFNPD